ncbi:hypothetical protein CBER1_08246 [Cercospora berteroae]|uniref:Dickkopf N-terminal cysteine-rich domain-containing protein n=1 Tax=Cercospora berteroae TaxID=357750 RepID=A0A2S6CES5_9PEZI|nr:hypothetical protein CBER1_08246 [Cercospora berteroae]
MRYSTAILAAAVSTVYAQSTITGTIVQPSGSPQVNAPANSLPLGTNCGADEQCQNGAQCFGSTAGTIRQCGNFNAECTSDSQCAYNSCNNGLCNGFLASSASTTAASSTASIVTGTIVQPSGAPQVTAPAGSVPLGGTCGADEQCQGEAQCWGSTAGTIRRCGNFNAGCERDSQCAYNSCNNGLCNGFLPSLAYPANTATASQTTLSTASGSAPTAPYGGGNGTTVAPTGGATNPTGGATNPTRTARPSGPSIVPSTGGAAALGATFSAFAAVVAGMATWVM